MTTGQGGSLHDEVRLILGETTIRIAEFVSSRPVTTSRDVVERFGVGRQSASQYLQRLWAGGYIGKRARGLFEPVNAAPILHEDCEDLDDSEYINDTDDVDDTYDVDESGDTYDSDDADEPDDSDDSEECEECEDSDGADTVDVTRGGGVDRPKAPMSAPPAAATCPKCGSPLGLTTGKCVDCILAHARAVVAKREVSDQDQLAGGVR